MNGSLCRRAFLTNIVGISQSINDRKVPLVEQKPLNVKIGNEKFTLELNVLYQDNTVNVSKYVEWYDPVNCEYLKKNENIMYIVDDIEL